MISAYLFENRHIGVKRCRHGIFAFNRNDSFIGRSLDQYGEWCEYELQLLGSLIKCGDTVIDAGANIGTHTVTFASMVGRSGKVVAFEAQPRLFNILCANLVLNGIEHVDARCEALSLASGELMQISELPPSDAAFNFGAVPLRSMVGGYSVRVASIDSLNLLDCALIKADVEGMEADVLLGAKQTIGKYKPVLYVENNGEESGLIAAALSDVGYKAYWSIGPYFHPNNFYGNQNDIWPNVMPSANLIAFPESAEIRFSGSLPDFKGPDDNWRKALARSTSKIRAPEPGMA